MYVICSYSLAREAVKCESKIRQNQDVGRVKKKLELIRAWEEGKANGDGGEGPLEAEGLTDSHYLFILFSFKNSKMNNFFL